MIKPGTIPYFCKAQSVAFAIKGDIDGELDRLEAAGIMERVTQSDWAAPIVAVPKKDDGCRICGDYMVMVNEALYVNRYPLPNPSELLATLAGG